VGGRLLAEKFGAARLGPMREHLRNFAEGFGITDMRFPDRSPNTRRVLAMAEYARDEGKLPRFRDLAMDAHWRQSKNLEDEADLRGIATDAGLDPDAALEASRDPAYQGRIDQRRREADADGVTGIPTFILGDRGVVGCQPYEILAKLADQQGVKRRGNT
jgi:predicted DsbA family dithiol-disulfide isomerase